MMNNNKNNNNYLFKISRDYPNLAIGEIEELLCTSLTEVSKGLFFQGKIHKKNIKKIFRLGLTKNIYEVHKKINSIELDSIIKNISSEEIKNDFKISSFSSKDNSPSTINIANKIHEIVPNNRVNLTSPKHNYFFIISEKSTFFCEEVFSNSDSGELRKSHLKKNNHPTSTHPKILKAMINLANTTSFIDPFCGSGGLLIEGALMNLSCQGSDISEKMVLYAKENCEELKVECKIIKKDALKYSKKDMKIKEKKREEKGTKQNKTKNNQTEENKTSSCFITDLPFGKNSLISKEINTLYEEFFILSQDLVEKMVVGFESSINMNKILSRSKWYIHKEFEYYVHKSMSRKIMILKKKMKK